MATKKFEITYAAHTTVVLGSIVFKSKTRQREKIKKKQQEILERLDFPDPNP